MQSTCHGSRESAGLPHLVDLFASVPVWNLARELTFEGLPEVVRTSAP
ncbi:MAG: hypothetical protein ACRDVM_05490 [Acidimicrobiia bacterium]